MNFRNVRLVAVCALVLAAVPVAAKTSDEDRLMRMMAGESALQGKKLDAAIQKAEQSPLGSKANPVRVSQPVGQRAYLARLRCSDGQAPAFVRAGNVGPGPFDNIVDLYRVTCSGGQPAEAEVHMDMYHLGHVENRAVPGFTLAL